MELIAKLIVFYVLRVLVVDLCTAQHSFQKDVCDPACRMQSLRYSRGGGLTLTDVFSFFRSLPPTYQTRSKSLPRISQNLTNDRQTPLSTVIQSTHRYSYYLYYSFLLTLTQEDGRVSNKPYNKVIIDGSRC